jgi:selenoprotein W-related protein
LTADLLAQLEPDIESITLIPSDGGRFEVTVNKKLIYSKLKTNRHTELGEIVGLIRKVLQEGF